MRWLSGAAAAALLASCVVVEVPVDDRSGTARPSATRPPPAASAPGSGERRLVEQMVDAVNAHRRAVRCPELVWMQAVANAARAHSDDMARRNYFNHTSPEGRGPADRLRAEHHAIYSAVAAGDRRLTDHPQRRVGLHRALSHRWLAPRAAT